VRRGDRGAADRSRRTMGLLGGHGRLKARTLRGIHRRTARDDHALPASSALERRVIRQDAIFLRKTSVAAVLEQSREQCGRVRASHAHSVRADEVKRSAGTKRRRGLKHEADDHRIVRTFGAGDGIRTRDNRLGKPALYQLSYSRARLLLLVYPDPLALSRGTRSELRGAVALKHMATR
jgi:hypothetical protein